MAIQSAWNMNPQAAFPGMIADTSLRNISGTNAASGIIQPGRAVGLVSRSLKGAVVKQVTDENDTLIGVSAHSHYWCVKGYYEDATPVNVMTDGTVWVELDAAATIVPESNVNVINIGDNASKFTATATAGTTTRPGWKFTGVVSDFNGTPIAEIRLRDIAA